MAVKRLRRALGAIGEAMARLGLAILDALTSPLTWL
jgi:hypothetical protein